mmetsp:Transcript_38281/g.94818  ORF Transcript_38281/g.94818 Transcript_38281/m.94818 type:complete len:200 (-) Transcript_38281:778-1377(-)
MRSPRGPARPGWARRTRRPRTRPRSRAARHRPPLCEMQKWGRSRCRSGAVEMRRRTGALIKHWGCSERAENGLNSRSRTQGPRLISKQRSAAVVATAAMPPKRKKPTAQAEGAAVEGGDAPPPGGRNQGRKRPLAGGDGLPGAGNFSPARMKVVALKCHRNRSGVRRLRLQALLAVLARASSRRARRADDDRLHSRRPT